MAVAIGEGGGDTGGGDTGGGDAGGGGELTTCQARRKNQGWALKLLLAPNSFLQGMDRRNHRNLRLLFQKGWRQECQKDR